MILIVSAANDVHTLCVAQELAKLDVRHEVVDAARLSLEGRLSVDIRDGGSRQRWTNVHGQPVALDEVRAVWHRRRPTPPSPALPDAADEQFVRREWEELLSGVFASMDCPFVNPPLAQRAAVKPLQLQWASRFGLRVPETLITNHAGEARDFVARHRGRVVHKVLSPPLHRWLGTMGWQPGDDALLDGLALAPTIFQQRIGGGRELRATMIGDEIFAAEFRVPEGLVDGRLADYAGYRPHVLPPDLSARLVRLARRLGLVFCTMDLKLTDEGEYVFLEINPQGQFLFVEILTGLPLSQAMARLLAGLADEGAADAPAPALHRTARAAQPA